MAASDEIKKLNEQIQQLNNQLGGGEIKVFDIGELNEAKLALKGLKTDLKDIQSDIGGISSAFKTVVDEISKSSKGLSDTKKTFNSLAGLAQQLKNDQVGINKLNAKQLVGIKEKIKAERANLVTSRDVLKNKQGTVGLTTDEEKALSEINGILTGNDGLYKNLLITAKARLAEEEKINDAMGLGGALINGLKGSLDKLGIGGLVNQLGITDAQEAMSKVADEVTRGGTEAAGFGGKVKVLKAGMGSLGKSIIKNLTDPLAIAKFLGDQLINAIKSVDKAAGDLAKSMNVSYQESLGIVDNMNDIANDSNSIFITSAKLAETQGFINKELGTTVMLTDEQLTTMTELREAAGFTNEELAGIAKISITTGKEMETITGEVLAQAKISSTRLGVVLNERDVVKEIAKVSAATTLSLGKSGEAIADAVATAKALGMELSKVDAIAGSILQFESSIENELSAELLIGKELNLEAARYYALTNQTSKLAEELAGNFGTAAEFQNMSRIQQEALAKAVGMNREELAQTLYVQEQLAGVSGKEAEKREKILNDRIKEVGLAQAQQEMAEEGYATLEQQASVQDRINVAVEKLSQIFVSLAEPILAIVSPLVDALMPALSFISQIVGTIASGFGAVLKFVSPLVIAMGTFMAISKTILAVQTAFNAAKAIGLALSGTELTIAQARGVIATKNFLKGIGSYAIQAAKAVAGIPVVGPFLAAGAAAAAVGTGMALYSKFNKADDLMSSPTGGSGYGDRILVGKEGAYSFNNRDTIQASTQGSPTQQSTSVVETKLYIDNEAFAQASSKSFSKL